MRAAIFILAGLTLAAGCASAPPPEAAARAPVAATLAIDPPLAMGAMPDLSRADREPSVYYGYQQEQTEIYDVQTDDDQRYQNNDSVYERQAISEKTGVIFH